MRDVTMSTIRPLALSEHLLNMSGFDLRKKHRVIIRLADTLGRNWTVLDDELSIKGVKAKRGVKATYRLCPPKDFKPLAWTVVLTSGDEVVTRTVPFTAPKS